MSQNKSKPGSMTHLVVIASSVGGVQALREIAASLPPNFPAAIVIAQHVSRSQPSHLSQILARETPMEVRQAASGDVLCHSCIFTAPSNVHVLVETGGVLRHSHSPPIHHTRPSAEPLFCSAAAIYGKNVLGVVLTGSDSDASLGVQVIKNAGGRIIVQNEETAVDFSMPQTAIETGAVDAVLPLNRIAAAMVEWTDVLKK